MKLQLALDRLSREDCLAVLRQTAPYIDWIEVGTGVIKEYGTEIITEIRNGYPDHTIVADMKTCDAGRHEAIQAFEAGADVTTVMAFSADGTICDMIDVARSYGTSVMIDLLNVDSAERVKELSALGADLFGLHNGKDMQAAGDHASASQFELVKGIEGRVAVAGGINEDTLPDIAAQKPDIVIVGSAITGAGDPEKAAARIKELMGR
ncbi:3-hexulose-6-phosphate synthase [Alteribacter natronophilus]|uniref:3-hexulose-6-phosphate synthase n=1 Tax=Alteribacter natronophilus TaxID=2583810 RepID=UPI00110E01A3|nr:3-hexulose-6-phosphate synthase [Alteribacter natronophilus]TMW72287.1 Fe-S cluster assembly protein HesB [Alteribacter natronophilus]